MKTQFSIPSSNKTAIFKALEKAEQEVKAKGGNLKFGVAKSRRKRISDTPLFSTGDKQTNLF